MSRRCPALAGPAPLAARVFIGFVFLLPLFGCAPAQHFSLPEPAAARAAIRENYDRNQPALSPETRGHWNVRMYRISGDADRIEAVREYALSARNYFIRHAAGLDEPLYAETAGRKFVESGPDTAKHRIRREVLRRDPRFAFRRRLVYLAFQMRSFGLHRGEMESYYRRALDWLGRESFRGILEDADIIRYDAAEAVNTVYYLKENGLEDLENVFTRRFREVFPDGILEDDRVVFENRIYGLTHFIIAATGYYQRFVPAEKFRWILDYFEKYQDVILARAKPDVIAEVGLCFKLAGLPDHPVALRAAAVMLQHFDPKLGVIPPRRVFIKPARGGARVQGRLGPPRRAAFDWTRSEHRNILAYMLLTDFDRLYPGPDLSLEGMDYERSASA